MTKKCVPSTYQKTNYRMLKGVISCLVRLNQGKADTNIVYIISCISGFKKSGQIKTYFTLFLVLSVCRTGENEQTLAYYCRKTTQQHRLSFIFLRFSQTKRNNFIFSWNPGKLYECHKNANAKKWKGEQIIGCFEYPEPIISTNAISSKS